MSRDSRARELDTTPPGDPTSGAGSPDFDLHHYIDVFRRRWWLIVAGGVLAVAGVWWSQRDVEPVPMYSAETLVQRVPTAIGAATMSRAALATSQVDIASELRILRTRAILSAVVDSVGLRLRLPEHPELHGRLFSTIEVSPQAASRRYQLQRVGDDVLLRAAGQEVARAGVGQPLVGPGFILGLADPELIPSGGTTLTIVEPSAAITALDRSMGVEQVANTNLIRISYSGPDPVLAAAVPNAVAAAYQRHAAQKMREEARATREFIEARLMTVTDSLEAAQDQLLTFQARAQSFNPRAEAEGVSDRLTQATEELRTLQEKERNLTDLIINLQDDKSEALRQMRLFSPDLVPGAVRLFEQLQTYEDQRNDLLNVRGRTVNAPEVQLLDSLMVETAAEIQALAEETLQITGETIDRQESRIADLRRQMGAAPEREWAFNRLEQRVEAIQRNHDMLTEQLHEAQIQEAVQSSDVQVVDPAVVPSGPAFYAGGKRSLPLAFVMGMFGGVALALVIDRLDTRIRRHDEVRRHSGAEIIGTIPVLPTEKSGGRPLVAQNGVVSSEAFRMLRTNLRFARTEALGTIAVTSAGPQEGKSVVTSNLALAMAQEGKKVLIVDADLRRPVIHGIFGVDRSPGLSDILVGEPTSAAIRTSEEFGIDILPAGTSVPNPAELVGSNAFRKFLERAGQNYDVVLVDTPPVLAVTDASVIATAVDGIVLVVRKDRTHRGALHGAAEQLRRSRASVLGVVINGADTTGGYGRYGSYGYGYGTREYVDDDDTKKRRFKIPFVG